LDSFLASFESEKKNDLTKYLINFFEVNIKKALPTIAGRAILY
jgi:hypothetical protein